MPISRKRFTGTAAAAALALLAFPSLVAARPGPAPELVQRRGRLVVVHADRHDGSSSRQWMLVSGTGHVRVRMPDDLWVDPGTPVRLEGTMKNGTLVLADSGTAVRQTGRSPLQADAAHTAADLAAAPAMHDTAVILFGFTGGPDHTELPTDVGAATTDMFGDPISAPDSLNSYYLEQTYGQIGFSGHVYGPFDITGSGCSFSDVYDWAGRAEAAAGINDSTYEHYVFVFPDVADCGWSGLAEVGGKHVWINGDFEVAVVAHELGHNLGLAHAGGLQCSDGGSPAPVGSSCSAIGFEYKDPFDAMGQSDPGTGGLVVRQMSMQHKLALNLLPPSAVQAVGISGTYHLAPMETLTGAVELLRLPKPGGGNYFVEYRRPLGWFDSRPPALGGVYIRTESPEVVADPTNPNADTALIDMHPTTGPPTAPWADARMSPGQIFNDALRGILVQDVLEDAGGAALSITLPADTNPPGRPQRLSASASGTAVVLHWGAAGDDYGVAGYRVARDGAEVGAPATTDFTDTGLAAGSTVAYTVTAVDGAGNVGPAAAVTVTVPDSERPTVPSNVTATVTRDGSVHVAWGASTDNGHLFGYQVMRGGTVVGSGNVTAYVDTAPRPGGGATVVYSVVAVDLAGNTSFPGNALPLRAALLRKLGFSNLKSLRAKTGRRRLVRVKGSVSDAKAQCRLRVGRAPWRLCRAKPTGAFGVSLRARSSKPVLLTLSLRDELGRVKQQTLRVR